VGSLVWGAGQIGLCYPMSLLASLTFGSVISATDPVTVLAVFQALGVESDLFSIVFGESVLNDAVAIVLSSTLISFTEVPFEESSVLFACVLFVTIFVGSLGIGAAFGVFSSLAFKSLAKGRPNQSEESHKYVELAFSFCFPWAAYFTSEALELSGIVAILSCGMTMATFTRPNFTKPAVAFTSDAYRGVALIAETFVFVYLGMACVTFPIFDSPSWMLVLFALLACFVGRLHIFLLSAVSNCSRGEATIPPPISRAYQFVMWFSGLRGGVAFALASLSYIRNDFPTKCGGLPEGAECAYGETTDSLAVLQCTMMIALFTIFVFGGSISYVAVELGVIAQAEEVARRSENRRLWTKPTLVRKMTSQLYGMLTVDGELEEFVEEARGEEEEEEEARGADTLPHGTTRAMTQSAPRVAPPGALRNSSRRPSYKSISHLLPAEVREGLENGGVRVKSPLKDTGKDAAEEERIRARAAQKAGRKASGAPALL